MRTVLARLLGAALAAGIVAGLIASLGQALKLTPLILAAEQYETEPHDSDTAGDPSLSAHSHAEAWQPAEGTERIAYTVLANIVAGTGFALLLCACLTLYRGRLDGVRGMAWGLAGFAVFALAPALGLPPELPGSAAAELGARQAWWLGTALATATGLALIFLQKRTAWRIVGALAIVAPHAVGAPHPHHIGGALPAELAAQFAVGSLVISAVFWIALGGVAGFALRRPR
ncbi:MAG: CbtA family protein [Alphaproteobacteria bacterium]